MKVIFCVSVSQKYMLSSWQVQLQNTSFAMLLYLNNISVSVLFFDVLQPISKLLAAPQL